jgi:hypothetical protein
VDNDHLVVAQMASQVTLLAVNVILLAVLDVVDRVLEVRLCYILGIHERLLVDISEMRLVRNLLVQLIA